MLHFAAKGIDFDFSRPRQSKSPRPVWSVCPSGEDALCVYLKCQIDLHNLAQFSATQRSEIIYQMISTQIGDHDNRVVFPTVGTGAKLLVKMHNHKRTFGNYIDLF